MAEDFAQGLSMAEVTHALDVVSETLGVLRDEAVAREPLEEALRRVAHTTVAAIPEADAASVTRLVTGSPETIAATDDTVIPIDESQYAAGRGPCLQAAESRSPIRAVIGQHRHEWPEFTAAAEEAGIHAYLSVPVLLDDRGQDSELIGSLNVYSFRPEAFDPFDEQLVRLFTTAASAAISNAQRWQRTRDHVEQLQAALISRAEIDQAKGVLMALHGISSDEAFERLTEISQRTNTKVHQVARDFMRNFTKEPP
ncbi:ANTAR domain-containing response regulator [Rhodococcus sp. T7]|uniref:ANTAR domain-containing response regulator n=1 Tax=Rhodococcus sp. T7 TaxID=627444 RepID=UPI0013C69305|nr:GAF and ANTAR domain-containing protein [Rhodococcus sp. T7]KAF0957378.1 hypothetical protein MLGJGCBP_09210 [Rhodococcus sp. T7]KAF0962151.1 hypothetical protein MLGJGCBP_04772 [Rhodococcus sp. T7]